MTRGANRALFGSDQSYTEDWLPIDGKNVGTKWVYCKKAIFNYMTADSSTASIYVHALSTNSSDEKPPKKQKNKNKSKLSSKSGSQASESSH